MITSCRICALDVAGQTNALPAVLINDHMHSTYDQSLDNILQIPAFISTTDQFSSHFDNDDTDELIAVKDVAFCDASTQLADGGAKQFDDNNQSTAQMKQGDHTELFHNTESHNKDKSTEQPIQLAETLNQSETTEKAGTSAQPDEIALAENAPIETAQLKIAQLTTNEQVETPKQQEMSQHVDSDQPNENKSSDKCKQSEPIEPIIDVESLDDDCENEKPRYSTSIISTQV